MTERIISVPQPLAQSQHAAQSPVATIPRGAPIVGDFVDEEPYTIKCICAYYDDDGNTIYCETCDTWQHIECFYPGNVEEASRDDFNHFCADCKPRELDRRRAYERQTEQRQDESRQDDVDKKARRPPSKSHKKKPKPSDAVANGVADSDSHHGTKGTTPHDHTTSHPKKSKSHHRSQQSISSQPPKTNPSNHSRNHSQVHLLSPATTPPDLPRNFPLFSYSNEFRKLCSSDPGAKDLQANSFASLAVTDAMSLWVRDKDKLRADTNIQKPDEVFEEVKHDFKFGPRLQVNSKEILVKNTSLQWRFLSVQEPLQLKDALVGELKGFVGFQKDYVKEDDAYAKLCHPAPFVFFHPRLPLYIDTRKEGSQCRYIRRSCRPNTTLDTCIYITNQSEYHFCFVAEQRLSPDTPITMPWDFRFPSAVRSRYLHLLGLADDGEPAVQDITLQEYEKLKDLIHNVLSNYGGCACDRGTDCAFVRFHRNFGGGNFQVQAQVQAPAPKPKKSRKPKQHVSPISTGHATNSRDASEGRQELYDAEDDSRSASGSIKPRSRDMTPLTAGFDANGAEPVSDRDKRKLADIEKTFEQMDKQPPKKKKRGSDGPSPSALPNGNAPTQRTKHKSVSRANAGISAPVQTNDSAQLQKDRNGVTSRRRPSESPVAVSPKTMGVASPKPGSGYGSVLSHSRQLSPVQVSNFVESAIQLEKGPWIDIIHSPCTQASLEPKKKCTWHRRRTIRKHQDNAEMRGSRSASLMSQTELKPRIEGLGLAASSQPSSPDLGSVGRPQKSQLANGTEHVDQSPPLENSTAIGEHIVNSADVLMPDSPPTSTEMATGPPPLVLPGGLHPQPENAQSDQRAPELKIQMPTVPPFPSNATVASSSIMSAPPFSISSPAGSSISQSPPGTSFPSALSPTVSNSASTQPTPPITKKMNLQSYLMRKKLPNSSTTPRADP